MTAHELARKLLAGPDSPVHFSYPYGDFWHTEAAPEVRRVDEKEVVPCSRIGSSRLLSDREENDLEREPGSVVVVIGG